MRRILIILFLGTLTLTLYSQNAAISELSFKNKNSIQFELFGHGLFYSFNYERILLNGQKFKTTAQTGVAYYPPKTNVMDLWIPVVINELLSFDKHHIEFGIGHVFVYESSQTPNDEAIQKDWTGFLTARIGYRFQKPDGRFIFRVGFTPFFDYEEREFYPVVGLAVGYSF